MSRQKSMKLALPSLEAAQSVKHASTQTQKNTKVPTAGHTSTKTAANTTEAQSKKASSTTFSKMNNTDSHRMRNHLDHNAMRFEHRFFDGKKFVTSTSLTEQMSYYRSYQSKLKSTLRTWNRMVGDRSKATDEGHQIAARVAKAEDWGKAMRAQYPQLEQLARKAQQQQKVAQASTESKVAQAKVSHREECQKYLDTALTPKRRNPIAILIQQMENGKSFISSPEEVNQFKSLALEFNQACQALDLKLITETSCWFAKNGRENNPSLACSAAARSTELIQGATLNAARRSAGVLGNYRVQSIDQFKKRNGWLTYEGPLHFNNHFKKGSAIPKSQREGILKLLASAGLDASSEKIWEGQDKRLRALLAEVEKTAVQWPIPTKKADNYSSDLAIESIKNWHPDAEIKQSYLSRKSWKIHKNALGAIDRRSLPGYVLFKLPDDPYCQLRSYTLIEQYAGGGQYEPASGVGIGYVRFQKCG